MHVHTVMLDHCYCARTVIMLDHSISVCLPQCTYKADACTLAVYTKNRVYAELSFEAIVVLQCGVVFEVPLSNVLAIPPRIVY